MGEPAPNLPTPPTVDLFDRISSFHRDPLGFALFAFDWGNGELKGKSLEVWQVLTLAKLGDRLQALPPAYSEEDWSAVIRESIASGHGVGKTALFAIIALWAMSTRVDCRGVVTANTETQLRTKTWATLQLWYRRCITREWFTLTATALHSVDPNHVKTWRLDAVPWSENNTEAFAGLHNEGKRLVILFDESSGIPAPIWETTQGALTDNRTEIIWVVAGNATRAVGEFVETWGKMRHRWGFLRVDSRSVTLTNKEQLEEWAADYGEDSDFFRVRVRGLPPKEDGESLFSIHAIEQAAARSIEDGTRGVDVVWGVDVGRQGPDPSVLARRSGSILYPFDVWRDTKKGAVLAGYVNKEYREAVNKPAWVNIDATGIGADVADMVTEKRADGFEVANALEVWVGGKADEPKRFGNIRAELFWRAADWLKQPDAVIPDDPELIGELSVVGAFRYDKAGRMFAPEKKDLKKELKRSPNKLDAFLLTFYRPKDKGPSILVF